jgi:hypothetical protein
MRRNGLGQVKSHHLNQSHEFNTSQIFWEVLNSKACINVPFYTQQLDRLAEVVLQKRPKKTKIILQHDNAKPHTAKMTKAKIQELGWEVLPLLIHRILRHWTITFSRTYKLPLKMCTSMIKKKSKHGLRTTLIPIPEFSLIETSAVCLHFGQGNPRRRSIL